MDESEKMVALKKAYAEIILNTAKEAAARVMASERKALLFQHDLKAAKDESLRMLLRVKQMLDAKTTEADINYISQRRRIEELEAQLEEAEDKILELRVELRNASEELEQQKKSELQVQVGKPTENAGVTSKDEMLHDRLNNLEPIVPYSSDSERETALSSDAVHKCLNSTKETRKLAFSHFQSYYSHGSDIASIIMRSTEAELYRNGCTQRVRAFERQQLDGTLPTKLASHKCITATNELKPKGSEKDGRKSILPFPQSNNVVRPKKISRQEHKKEEKKLREESANRRRLWRRQIRKTRTLVRKEKAKERAREKRSKEWEESNSARSSSVQLIMCSQASSAVADHNLCSETDDVKVGECVNAGARNNKMEVYPGELPEKLSGSFSKFIESNIPIGKRKRSATRRKCLGISAESSAHQLGTTCQPPDTSRYETNSVDAQDVSGDCYLKGNEETVGMRSPPRLDPLLLLSNSMEEDRIKLKMDMPTKVEGQELSGASGSKRQQDSDVADIPSTPPGKLDNGMTDVPVTISQGPVEAKDSRLVRYTFQRKRKKEPLSYPDEDVALDQGNLKRCSMERDDNVEESKKCSLINDSSRDSRRLAQVARQLISLSGKKW